MLTLVLNLIYPHNLLFSYVFILIVLIVYAVGTL